jgi:predicted TIM-barrel fold metal-dependent hydrolase
VRLFTPALVDFEFWLKNDKPHTSFLNQIELGGRLASAFPGRIHFFAPFDPWREIEHAPGEPSSLDLVKRAVTEYGFVGVKLYPPMGFAASGNVGLDFSRVGVKNSRVFGAKIDRALESLFAWAVEEGVPLMAHCNLSQEPKQGFAQRASPAFWTKVLSDHHGLRLNLGHFGGQDNLGPGGVNAAADWPEAIIALMKKKPEGEHLYTDVGNFDMNKSAWFGTLKTTMQGDPVLLSRLMYGSDWMMLATSAGYTEFLDRFRNRLASLTGLTDTQIEAVLGENARDFLGLKPGEKSRLRLEAFYDRNDIPRPDWLQ